MYGGQGFVDRKGCLLQRWEHLGSQQDHVQFCILHWLSSYCFEQTHKANFWTGSWTMHNLSPTHVFPCEDDWTDSDDEQLRIQWGTLSADTGYSHGYEDGSLICQHFHGEARITTSTANYKQTIHLVALYWWHFLQSGLLVRRDSSNSYKKSTTSTQPSNLHQVQKVHPFPGHQSHHWGH